MVERIDNSNRAEDYWKIQSTAQTDKDPSQEQAKDEFAGFQEKTDWNILFDKSKLWKRNIQIQKDEIVSIRFQKINLKTDPSLLRVDIQLNDGQEISPAFLAISRMDGLKIKNLSAGDLINPETLLKSDILTVTIPSNPDLFKQVPEEKIPVVPEKKPIVHPEDDEQTIAQSPFQKWFTQFNMFDPNSKNLRPEIMFAYAVLGLMLFIFIWGYFLLK